MAIWVLVYVVPLACLAPAGVLVQQSRGFEGWDLLRGELGRGLRVAEVLDEGLVRVARGLLAGGWAGVAGVAVGRPCALAMSASAFGTGALARRASWPPA